MDDARWRQIDALLAGALEWSGAARDAFLDEHCGDDQDLRRAVGRLLAVEDEAQSFLEQPDRFEAAYPPAAAPLVGEQIGPYRLVRSLGHGGMGSVYLGRREHDYEQEVAIKLVRWGLLGRKVEQRFRTERQALAQLEHPNVARLYDGGTTAEGLPYLVMERIEGLPIDRYCDHHRLPLARRLELFQQVCAALSHAHRRLLVHCDIKPSNVLVTADGTPKLLDFGIAKLLRAGELAGDSTAGEATRTGWRPLTLGYASPEQILGEPITTASDVYSLGVLLYVLLCGSPPHRVDSASFLGLSQIVEQDPERPSRQLLRVATEPGDVDPAERSRRRGARPRELRRQLEGDLDAIVLKAIRKLPAQRYASVAELSRDVACYLEGRRVLARRNTWRYRASKLLRRVFWPPDRGRRRERLLWAAALAAVLGAWWAIARLGQLEGPCADSDSRLAGVWDDAARSAVRDAFLATAQPFAGPAWTRIEPNHVLAARALVNLAAYYGSTDRYEEGFELASRALGILESASGESNPELGYLLTMLAQFRSSLGRPGDAIGYLERALPLVETRLGATASLVAEVHHAYAQALHLMGREEEALAHAEKADRIYAVSRQPEHFSRLWLLALLGNIQREAGDLPAAITSHERLLVLVFGGPDPPAAMAPEMLLAIGETFTAAGRQSEARELLEKALQEPAEADAWTLAQLRFALARALWLHEQQRARGLAEHATAGLDTDLPLYRRFRDRVSAWLRDRHGPAG